MRRILLLGATIAAFVFVPASRAVTIRGTDTHPWQRWAAEAEVPTVSGNVVLEPQSFCDIPGVESASGCSNWTAPWEMYASGRWEFYYELGHIFDYAVLTSHDRATLARIWGAPHVRWSDSDGSLTKGNEDGLAADFAAAYAACAEASPLPTGLVSGFAQPITLHGTCRYIRRLHRAAFTQTRSPAHTGVAS